MINLSLLLEYIRKRGYELAYIASIGNSQWRVTIRTPTLNLSGFPDYFSGEDIDIDRAIQKALNAPGGAFKSKVEDLA